ncbi:hypothetical protein [Dehalogenimonas alkenigignens]|uniref:hypothetical protein n=1 Tax=Dehalogenimonas alkenigignens TaxID=1217799 RepID=UPI000D575A17|nr:hypothetical protein [Dehalogenimonas alkenigignens]PVV83741.1 hypothetical protein DD509_05800 [Dehalogenimonas alkenigignens]
MRTKAEALSEASLWFADAQKEYKWYLRICRPNAKNHKPIEYPEGGLPHLQQAIEKMVKSIAIASGNYDIGRIRKYSHHSLHIWIDLMSEMIGQQKVIDWLVLLKTHLDSDNYVFPTPRQALYQLTTIKTNTESKSKRKPDTPDWYSEFARLPAQQINILLDLCMTILNLTRSKIYKTLGPNIVIDSAAALVYIENPTNENFSKAISPSFRSGKIPDQGITFAFELFKSGAGQDLSTYLKGIMDESVNIGRHSLVTIGTRKQIENQIIDSMTLPLLMSLAAITFPHGRYIQLDNTNVEFPGILDCVEKLGNVVREVLKSMPATLEDAWDTHNMNQLP